MVMVPPTITFTYFYLMTFWYKFVLIEELSYSFHLCCTFSFYECNLFTFSISCQKTHFSALLFLVSLWIPTSVFCRFSISAHFLSSPFSFAVYIYFWCFDLNIYSVTFFGIICCLFQEFHQSVTSFFFVFGMSSFVVVTCAFLKVFILVQKFCICS